MVSHNLCAPVKVLVVQPYSHNHGHISTRDTILEVSARHRHYNKRSVLASIEMRHIARHRKRSLTTSWTAGVHSMLKAVLDVPRPPNYPVPGPLPERTRSSRACGCAFHAARHIRSHLSHPGAQVNTSRNMLRLVFDRKGSARAEFDARNPHLAAGIIEAHCHTVR